MVSFVLPLDVDFINQNAVSVHPRGGHSLCWAVRYARLYMGCFWEMFCTFSVRWVPRSFQQNFCIFSARWVSILKKLSVLVKQDGTHLQEIFCISFQKVGGILHIKFLYVSARWVSFQEIYSSGWNQFKRSCKLSQILLIDCNNHLSRTGLFTNV